LEKHPFPHQDIFLKIGKAVFLIVHFLFKCLQHAVQCKPDIKGPFRPRNPLGGYKRCLSIPSKSRILITADGHPVNVDSATKCMP
jgi:hypothetical protein